MNIKGRDLNRHLKEFPENLGEEQGEYFHQDTANKVIGKSY